MRKHTAEREALERARMKLKRIVGGTPDELSPVEARALLALLDSAEERAEVTLVLYPEAIASVPRWDRECVVCAHKWVESEMGVDCPACASALEEEREAYCHLCGTRDCPTVRAPTEEQERRTPEIPTCPWCAEPVPVGRHVGDCPERATPTEEQTDG